MYRAQGTELEFLLPFSIWLALGHYDCRGVLRGLQIWRQMQSARGMGGMLEVCSEVNSSNIRWLTQISGNWAAS